MYNGLFFAKVCAHSFGIIAFACSHHSVVGVFLSPFSKCFLLLSKDYIYYLDALMNNEYYYLEEETPTRKGHYRTNEGFRIHLHKDF